MFSYDSVLGCILGGALGDVLGGVPERKALSFSDDTQLTIATCEAILERRGASAEVIARHMLRWFVEGRISGIGASTLKAMRDLQAGNHWALSGARGERAAGNGAAMRAAPLAFVLDPEVPEERREIRDIARITHHHEEAYASALAVILAVRNAAMTHQVPSHGVIADMLFDSRTRDHLLAYDEAPGMPLAEQARVFGASGYAPETIALALSVAQRGASSALQQVLEALAEIPGDTDTIGAIAGNISGAALGAERLPLAVLTSVPHTSEVVEVAEQFARAIRASRTNPH